MFTNKNKKERFSLIERLLNKEPRNHRQLAQSLGVDQKTVARDVARAQKHGLLLWEDERRRLHVFDKDKI